jgi:Secretion system C-terminal sorting domain
MKNKLVLLIAFLSQSLFGQNDSLTVGQVYNYTVGDSLQYNVYNYTNYFSPRSIERIYKSRQVVILDKKIDSVNNKMTIHKSVEEFGYARSGPILIMPFYSKTHEFENFRNINLRAKTIHKCPNIPNPTTFLYCGDSIVLDYGSRKTLKHDYNRQLVQQITEHYTEGLGMTLLKKSGEDPTFFDDINLLYHNSKGQKWGTRTDVFDVQKPMFKPLTNREVYDFEVGDMFLYLQVFYNFIKGKLDSNYQQITILNRRLSANNDSLIYAVKSELANATSLKQVEVKTDTLKFGQLDSVAIDELKPTDKFFNSDYFFTFSDNKRIANIRSLVCNCLDFFNDITVGQGIGTTYRQTGFPEFEQLIYYKKGSNTWGTPVILSSITTPSVFLEKIKVFPNPTNQILNIETEGRFDRLQLVNVYGQIALIQKKTSAVDVSDLPNGLYFLQIFEGNMLRGVEKVIVKH